MTQTVVENPTETRPAGPKIVTPTTRTMITSGDRCTASTRVQNREKKTCGAEAFVKVTYPFEVERFRCGHHANQEWPSILAHAVEVVDERDLINREASVSANAIAD